METVCGCTYTSVYILLTDDVMALQSANGGISHYQVLKQRLSPMKVATEKHMLPYDSCMQCSQYFLICISFAIA